MKRSVITINHIGFLTPSNYSDINPFRGLEQTLQLLGYGEALGFDSAWVRQRHLEPGISSATAFLAAATQRNSHIQLGTAVIPMGYESPYRLAEDLSMVNVFSQGRLNVGLSAGRPLHADLIAPLIFHDDWEDLDFTHDRVLRFTGNLRGAYLGDKAITIKTPFGPRRPRLQPHAQGLIDRIWYGGGSLRSANWAGANGFNLLMGNVTTGEETDDFFVAQARQLKAYRRASDGRGRVALGGVIVPIDGASPATRRRYRDYAAGRSEGTLGHVGGRRTLFVPDLVGTADEIVERLLADPILPEVGEFRLGLPYEFEDEEYRQILGDFVTLIAPRLGGVDPRRHGQALTQAPNRSIGNG
jgi:alkanesulfonate monooxygenase SsuD/methylene tetrahydromethanopterin reductase-like flavin-dependent oxidoreductase (luciferase family)